MDGITAPAASWEADILPLRLKTYESHWLDTLCVSGLVAWGRYIPPDHNFRRNKKNTPSPVKNMPLTFVTSENKDIWIALAQEKLEKKGDFFCSEMVKKIEDDLWTQGIADPESNG